MRCIERFFLVLKNVRHELDFFRIEKINKFKQKNQVRSYLVVFLRMNVIIVFLYVIRSEEKYKDNLFNLDWTYNF